MKNSNKAKENETENKKKKSELFKDLFDKMNFERAIGKYMLSTKILLATIEEAEFEDLKILFEINQKLGKRIENMISIKENESESMVELMNELTDKYKEK